MKKLYIIRHAKSSWEEVGFVDFDRPLNKRGKIDASKMGDRLRTKGVKPDIILSSDALRAKKTIKAIAKKVKFKNKIKFRKKIYEASLSTLHKMIKKVDNKNSTLFLCGHNFELNMMAQKYVGLDENIPTCGIVEIEFNCNKWKDISKQNARLISFDYPKN
ncbi:SixA phosphatase family protein [Sulfurimonas sp.]|uniref:SixA phosphatase family protein n=1 Tax=Sulfurimonas sp. TaxID=2022749 RepID=UPI002AAF542B|nr:histidine phosphatase family protein [Sulfurimonas sp.]